MNRGKACGSYNEPIPSIHPRAWKDVVQQCGFTLLERLDEKAFILREEEERAALP